MDRTFLTYYEGELAHIREMAAEFAALHPNVARSLSLDSVPCPDPYVERLLEGVAYLAARTRLKVDGESSRYVLNTLDALYPDLSSPTPAVTTVVLHPGPQVQTLLGGHIVKRGTRLASAFREGLATRATFTTCQDVSLWPIALDKVEYLQNRAALSAGNLSDQAIQGAEAGIRFTFRASGASAISALSLDQLDLNFESGARGGAIFDGIFGGSIAVHARSTIKGSAYRKTPNVQMVGIQDSEAVLPRLRSAFEGYRLLREYFMMPDRFHYVRLSGLSKTVKECSSGKLECVVLLSKTTPEIADISEKDFRLFATPIANLFEKECNVVEVDPRTSSHIVHADRTRPRDYEIYRVLRVEDADSDGPDAVLTPLYSMEQNRGNGTVYTTERRPSRPNEEEIRRGQTRTSYLGDDVYVSVAYMKNARGGASLKRLDIRALCTNRDLAILDESPRLSLETGDPISRVEMIGAMRPPRRSLVAAAPISTQVGVAQLDDLSWRLVGQFALNHLSLAEESRNAEPLRAMLDLYADRGDPITARHARSITQVTSRSVTSRLEVAGPMCFGKGTEITLSVDETVLSGSSKFLLSAILAKLFARHCGINSFVKTRTKLVQKQEEVAWPLSPGNRATI
jgi:type VI secretion system protein ImpG